MTQKTTRKPFRWIAAGALTLIVLGTLSISVANQSPEDQVAATPSSSSTDEPLTFNATVESEVKVAVENLTVEPEKYVIPQILEEAGGSPFPAGLSFTMVDGSLIQITDEDATVVVQEMNDGVSGDMIQMSFILNEGVWQLVTLQVSE